MAATVKEREEAQERLREMLPPGATVTTNLRHVSRSGMMRAIQCHILKDSDVRWIDTLVCKATGYPFSERYEAVRADGCGMDMGFAVVYDLAHSLYPDGFQCIGDRCPSNDHSNRDRNYKPHHHGDGGYALRHRWL